MSSSHKVSCFKIPRKLKSQGVDVEEFFNEYLEDDGTLKEERKDEILGMLREAQAKTKTKKAKSEDSSGPETLMDRLKKAAEEDGDEEPAKKKAKGAKDEDFSSMLRAYKRYNKGVKASELKDILRWNKQIMTGNKEFVLFKVIDGVTNGRLSLCPLCPGTSLKFLEGDYDTIYCGGAYDEGT